MHSSGDIICIFLVGECVVVVCPLGESVTDGDENPTGLDQVALDRLLHGIEGPLGILAMGDPVHRVPHLRVDPSLHSPHYRPFRSTPGLQRT